MKKCIVIAILLMNQLSYADLPLTVENIIAEQGKTTLELGLTYGNNKISNTKVGGYIPVQVSDTSFVNVPTLVNDEQIQNEFLIATIGAKYGVINTFDYYNRNNLDISYGSRPYFSHYTYNRNHQYIRVK